MTFNRTRCAHCKKRLNPERPSQIVHVECVEAWSIAQAAKREREEAKKARAAAKVERAETRKKLEEFKKIPELIAAAQIQFNAFIRARDKEKGCFVCGRPFENKPGRVQHAGHVRSRGAAGHLRFNELNCHGECEGCNGPYGAKPHELREGAIRRIGLEAFEKLESNNTPHKWQREELREIAQTYRHKRKALGA
jgi:hypothetical protein